MGKVVTPPTEQTGEEVEQSLPAMAKVGDPPPTQYANNPEAPQSPMTKTNLEAHRILTGEGGCSDTDTHLPFCLRD